MAFMKDMWNSVQDSPGRKLSVQAQGHGAGRSGVASLPAQESPPLPGRKDSEELQPSCCTCCDRPAELCLWEQASAGWATEPSCAARPTL